MVSKAHDDLLQRSISFHSPHARLSWHVPARKQENPGYGEAGGGEGAYLELCSRHLSKKDGFGGCLTAGAVAEGRPRGQPLPSPTLVSGRLKLKPGL